MVVLELARRLRRKSDAIYARFMRVAARFLVAAEISTPDRERPRRPLVDLTETSHDGVAN